MITVHHLDDSRSQRILWLLEELGVPYEIRQHKRDPRTRLAPPELKQVHPLGKSPVIEDNGRVIAESGAIMEYILRRYGNGRLQPAPTDAKYDDYVPLDALCGRLWHAGIDHTHQCRAGRRSGCRGIATPRF
jgi:glutathione S-transferase